MPVLNYCKNCMVYKILHITLLKSKHNENHFNIRKITFYMKTTYRSLLYQYNICSDSQKQKIISSKKFAHSFHYFVVHKTIEFLLVSQFSLHIIYKSHIIYSKYETISHNTLLSMIVLLAHVNTMVCLIKKNKRKFFNTNGRVTK